MPAIGTLFSVSSLLFFSGLASQGAVTYVRGQAQWEYGQKLAAESPAKSPGDAKKQTTGSFSSHASGASPASSANTHASSGGSGGSIIQQIVSTGTPVPGTGSVITFEGSFTVPNPSLGSVSGSFVRSDPEAAAAWVATISDTSDREYVLIGLVQQMTLHDPAAALLWAQHLEQGGSAEALLEWGRSTGRDQEALAAGSFTSENRYRGRDLGNTAVPEPGAALLLVFAIAAGTISRRRLKA